MRSHEKTTKNDNIFEDGFLKGATITDTLHRPGDDNEKLDSGKLKGKLDWMLRYMIGSIEILPSITTDSQIKLRLSVASAKGSTALKVPHIFKCYRSACILSAFPICSSQQALTGTARGKRYSATVCYRPS